MSLEALRERMPECAKDIKLNLGSLMNETVLSDQQKWGALRACAYAAGAPQMIADIEAETEARLSPEAVRAVGAAASLMAMNNVYYRALHFMENGEYKTLRAGLRMNGLAAPGVEKADFELWCFAVSAIGGCGACLDSHEQELRKHGVSALQIQAALRIAAVVNGAAAALRVAGI